MARIIKSGGGAFIQADVFIRQNIVTNSVSMNNSGSDILAPLSLLRAAVTSGFAIYRGQSASSGGVSRFLNHRELYQEL